MRKRIRSWIVVADSARAQVFETDEEQTRLIQRELTGLPEQEVAHYSRDLGSDRPGRNFGSAGGGVRHAIEPQHDYHKQEKHAFAVALAEALNRSHQAKEYDRLVLVVPPRTLGELRHFLSASLQASMEVVPKDLTKAPLESIWAEVATLVHRRPISATH
jgi:protein required for attachment to host cells